MGVGVGVGMCVGMCVGVSVNIVGVGVSVKKVWMVMNFFHYMKFVFKICHLSQYLEFSVVAILYMDRWEINPKIMQW